MIYTIKLYHVITFDEVKIWFSTKINVTNIPPLPGTDFGGTKKEIEDIVVNPMQGK